MIVIAFASPMPLYCISSCSDILPKVLRLLSQALSMRCMSATALSFVLPEPMSIASSSASDSVSAPLSRSFSRGRSASDQSEIFS